MARSGAGRSVEREVLVGEHYPLVTLGLIAGDETWCATAGQGLVVYFVRPPYAPYSGEAATPQWEDLGRYAGGGSSAIAAIEEIAPGILRAWRPTTTGERPVFDLDVVRGKVKVLPG